MNSTNLLTTTRHECLLGCKPAPLHGCELAPGFAIHPIHPNNQVSACTITTLGPNKLDQSYNTDTRAYRIHSHEDFHPHFERVVWDPQVTRRIPSVNFHRTIRVIDHKTIEYRFPRPLHPASNKTTTPNHHRHVLSHNMETRHCCPNLRIRIKI